MTDTTMQSLLDVHRTELNARDTEITNLKSIQQSMKTRHEFDMRDMKAKLDNSERRRKSFEKELSDQVDENSDKDARIAKLQEANESLNQLLTSERSAFSAYRDTQASNERAEGEDDSPLAWVGIDSNGDQEFYIARRDGGYYIADGGHSHVPDLPDDAVVILYSATRSVR